jgi:Copper type II ascorbate-dependent monooxygenase, C-terminal domain
MRASAPPTAPTFSREVVRLFQQHCQVCHHPGGLGPFSLVDYASAKPYAPLIRLYVQAGLMPPWKPAAGCGDFAAPNRLSSSEIRPIVDWVNQGSPEGDPAGLPPPMTFPATWALGTPDVIQQMPVPYTPDPMVDTFRMFPLHVRFDHDVYVDGVEVHPLATSAVHHVLVHVDATTTADSLEYQDGSPGYRIDGMGNGFPDAAFLGTWIPGDIPFRMPPGHAILIPAGGEIVLELHYHAHSGAAVTDQTMVGLHFARTHISKLVQYGIIDQTHFVVPANDPAYVVTDSWTPPQAIHLDTMGGHMHWLGHRFSATATRPDGSTECLLHIDDWDVHWQALYRYTAPVALPAGSRIDTRCEYDNTSNNPANPFNPPQDVPYGGRSDHEMCFTYFTYTWDDETVDINPSQ